MNILIRGSDSQIDEFQSKFDIKEGINFDNDNTAVIKSGNYDVIFDFFLDDSPENLDQYADISDLVVFCNSVKTSLSEFSLILDHSFSFKMIGFNGMPTFLNHEIMELTILDKADLSLVERLCSSLGTDFIVVEDRVGMVTPRVISMIINEAYYTVQEGTADKESIDLAMKLGTNYPFGPFEWAEKIGIKDVFELLEALYEDTKDERYRICSALKREYMLN